MNAVKAAAILSIALASPAAAQESGGLYGTVVLGFGLLHQDRQSQSIGALRTQFRSETRTQMLKFDLDLARLSGTGLQGTTALTYRRETKSTAIALEFRHTNHPARAFQPDLGLSEEHVDISDLDAKTESSTAALLLRVGVGRPLGFDFEVGHRRRNVKGAPGVQNLGRRSWLDAKARFDLSKRSSAHFRLGFGNFDGAGVSASTEKTRHWQIGLAQKLNARIAVDAALGWREIEARDAVGPVKNSGGEWEVAVTSARKTNRIYAHLSRRVTAFGMLSEASVGAAQDLKEMRVDLELGVARLAKGKSEPKVRLSFSKSYPKASLKLELSRGFIASDIATGIRLASRGHLHATHKVGYLGNLELQVDVVKSASNANLPPRSTRQMQVAYTHALSPDWSLAGGAHRRVTRDSGMKRRASNGVFLRLERRFSGGL